MKAFYQAFYSEDKDFEEFDYTKWQQTHLDELTPEQIDDAAKQYAEEHPFRGSARVVL